MTCPYLKEFHLSGILKGTSCTAYENGRLRTPTLFEQRFYCRSEGHAGCLTFRCRLAAERERFDDEAADLTFLGAE